MTRRPKIRAVCVVVPAHDEEELVGRCLDGLAEAAGRAAAAGIDVRLTFVLDDCHDRTPEIVRARAMPVPLEVVETDARSVGVARALGTSAALGGTDAPLDAVWLAHTDADSCVPPGWLVDQVTLADGGADVVVGTVRPDPADLSDGQLRAWACTRVPGRPNGHVHGANLGMRASAYVAAGGFAPEPLHEDVHLAERLRTAPGVVVVASDVVDVLTSGRPVGRAPGGYARYLREGLAPA